MGCGVAMNSFGIAVCRALGLREAAASVALSHDAGCACMTCLAARGDNAAMAALVANLMIADQEFLDASEVTPPEEPTAPKGAA